MHTETSDLSLQSSTTSWQIAGLYVVCVLVETGILSLIEVSPTILQTDL